MSVRLREEAGMTLTEVMVVSLILVVVLGALLSAFDTFQKTTSTNQRLNDVQDSVRVSVDGMTREMRNLASPVDGDPQSVKRSEATDLIFLSVAGSRPAGSLNTRNTRQVRYCLDGSGTLWREQQTWTTATAPAWPTTTSCPGSGWPTSRVMVKSVTNGSRPVFTYNSDVDTAITEVGVSVFIDIYPGHSPKEVALQSAVFLRNQNRAPIAQFDLKASGGTLVLNGSASSDPEGRALSFYWYDEARTDNLCGTLPSGVPTSGCIGTGLVFNYTPPTAGSRTIHLIVSDGRLTAQSASQSS